MESYSGKELMRIFEKKVFEQEWMFLDNSTITEKWFHDKIKYFKHFGRDMELLLLYTKMAHSKRIYGKSLELRKKLTIDDLNSGYDTFLKNKNIDKSKDYLNDIYV